MKWKKYPDTATTITVGNYKGGAGKTTNTVMLAYTLARRGIKTLVIDCDPQSNATKALMLTKLANSNDSEITAISKTLMKGIQDNNLDDLPIQIIDNLFLIPSFIDFEDFPKYLYTHFNSPTEQDMLLNSLLKELKKQYDLIFIDVPPMSLEITKNAICASDYVLISLQTQERSLTGAENYVAQLIKLRQQYALDLEVVGVLPVLLKNQGTVDMFIIEKATEKFGEENMFQNIVPQMERIKRFDINGICDVDRFDRKVLEVYSSVADEFLDKMSDFSEE